MLRSVSVLWAAAQSSTSTTELPEILLGAAGGAVFTVVSIVRSESDDFARTRLHDPIFWLASVVRVVVGAFMVWLVSDSKIDPFITGMGAVGLLALLVGGSSRG